MDINKFLEELDQLFSKKELNKVEPFLNKELQMAESSKDSSAIFTILNEMMGFFRDTSQYDKALDACHKCLALMKEMGIEGTVDYATSLQNIANAHRAAGLYKESLDYYKEAFDIYKDNIPSGDYRMASINNNIALLYQEMGDFEEAVNHLKKALDIIQKLDDSDIPVAVTKSNLAASLLELEKTDEAIDYLEEALITYRKDKVKNFHYSAALSAMATAMCKKKEYEKAVLLYEEALVEIEINMGRGTAYEITQANLNQVKSILGQDISPNTSEDDNGKLTGIELSDLFYQEYGKKMIHDKFPDFEKEIAVGFIGEGSERFGFDDEYSMDHDFGPGFCMWVTDDVYQTIGEKLQEEYDRLPKTYKGVTRVDTKMASGRVGVDTISHFYKKYTGYVEPPENLQDFVNIEDYKLASVSNGVVFRDDEGIFSKIRHDYKNMPNEVKYAKIAREISAMAQTGQCNYARSMARKDYVTAHICITEFLQHGMKCLYLLNNQYAPYYKWMFKGLTGIEILPEMKSIFRAIADMPDQREAWKEYQYSNTEINPDDNIAGAIEIACTLFIKELFRQGMIDNTDSDFLNDYVGVIMEKAEYNRDNTIDEIIHMEFEAFDKVKNEGGRADCQNNWPFFYIMRKSQYMTWTDEMLLEIKTLWQLNKARGWNMITEKYGRMMESTDKKEYDKIKDNFPVRSEQTIKLVDKIAEIQVTWMEDFSKKYPKLAGNARDISSSSDSTYNTSYETYLKGELLTYSDHLLKLYAEFVVDLYKKNKNLAYLTIENTAHLQGYENLDQAESRI